MQGQYSVLDDQLRSTVIETNVYVSESVTFAIILMEQTKSIYIYSFIPSSSLVNFEKLKNKNLLVKN